jgi:hypothetical protein
VDADFDGDADGMARPDIGARENEGVTGMRFAPGHVLAWDSAGSGFDPYRGDLETFRETGIVTQDPMEVDGAEVICMLAQPGFISTRTRNRTETSSTSSPSVAYLTKARWACPETAPLGSRRSSTAWTDPA